MTRNSLTQAARLWARDRAIDSPNITISPIDIPSGRAVTYHSGVMHTVADAVEVSDGTNSVIAATWICGANSVRVMLAEENDDRVRCVSCQLAAALPQCPVVYFAWGADDELLYVGSTIKAHQRIRAHMTQTRWWPEVKRLSFTECASEIECRRVEAEAIRETPGIYNREGVPTKTSPLDALALLVEASA
jgi:hypothetical protein